MKRYAWVVEWHEKVCSVCHSFAWCLAVFVGKGWISGANPEGPETVALCKGCLESSEVGPFVGPEL